MTLESNIVNEIKFLQFNDEKAMNAISADAVSYTHLRAHET